MFRFYHHHFVYFCYFWIYCLFPAHHHQVVLGLNKHDDENNNNDETSSLSTADTTNLRKQLGNIFQQKQQQESKYNIRAPTESYRKGNMRINKATGSPLAIYNPNIYVGGSEGEDSAFGDKRKRRNLAKTATMKEKADYFVATYYYESLLNNRNNRNNQSGRSYPYTTENNDNESTGATYYSDILSKEMGLEYEIDYPIGGERHADNDDGVIWHIVRYKQYYHHTTTSIPVYAGELCVTIDPNQNVVKMLTGNYFPGISLIDANNRNDPFFATPKITQEDCFYKTMLKFFHMDTDISSSSSPPSTHNNHDTNENRLFQEYESNLVLYHQYAATSDTSSSSKQQLLEGRLAWQVTVRAKQDYHRYEIIYDANTGNTLNEEDLTLDKKKKERTQTTDGSSPSIIQKQSLQHILHTEAQRKTEKGERNNEQSEKVRRNLLSSFESATGKATVFDPDPISTTPFFKTKILPFIGFHDNGDRDSIRLQQELMDVTLHNISLNIETGEYFLEGPYVKIIDTDYPHDGIFQSSTELEEGVGDFISNRGDDNFEAVNCYFHIDHYMKYLIFDLNLGDSVMPFYFYDDYTGGYGPVECDPHAVDREDNSYYLGGAVFFGEGGIDDAEDADVILHELGHGIHDFLTIGHLSQVEGLSEGIGDYIAMSYSRSKGLLEKEPIKSKEYDWVFKWDGHNHFWPGRITDYCAQYPDDLVNQVHSDGQIWSTCNMRLYDLIGRERLDKAMFVAIAATTSSTNQEDLANAVYQAAFTMRYKEDEISKILDIYRECGYDISEEVCGDGIVSVNEECDSSNLNGASCADIGCSTTGLPLCNAFCKLDYGSCTADPESQFTFRFDLITDYYATETSWDVSDSSGNRYFEVAEGEYEIPLYLYREHMCLDVLDGAQCHNFTLHDQFGDGINLGLGGFNLFIDNNEVNCTGNEEFDTKLTYYLCPDGGNNTCWDQEFYW